MATRHELIHIDFVANAGKANPVLKSLQVSCNDARIAKEQLDAKLKDAKAMNAPAEVITNLEKKLKSQTTTWQQLERGLREYTKGIDTLSKGIKEFNDGTLDEMSAKFNKAVYNAAKLAQSAVKTGSSDWNQLQRLMDATDRNVTRAREDIDLMMQSLKDGSAVSTVQLTRSREVLEDLARLAVTNSEEWRGLRKQFNDVDAAFASVTETEKRLKGEIATENDAIALSNSLTKESITLRHADGEAAMKAAQAERKGVEEAMRGISDRIVLRTKERDTIQEEIEIQEDLDNIIKERGKEILSIQNRKQEAEQRKAQAQATIKEYDEQEKKVQELKLQKKDLEEQQKKETREAEKSVKAIEEQNKKQAELTQTVSTLKGEIGGLETSLQGLEEQIKKTSAEPIKPKVDTSKIEELQAKLKAVQDGIAEKNAQIEAESKKGGLANKWQETLTRLQGDKDGRLSPMGLGDDKKQMHDILDVANNFYEIIKKVKGVTEDGFIPTPAAEPIKQLAEYYKITEEEARKLVKTLQQSEVVNKKFGTFDYNEMTGFLAINKNKGKDDQQVRIEAAQSYMKAAERSEGNLAEKVNKLLADKKELEEKEIEIKGKLQAATEGVAVSTDKSSSATERRMNLTKKEKEEVKKLTDENNSLTGTIDALKKQLDSLSVSQGKATESIKDGAEAAKGEAKAMKMTAEEAKAALAKMTEKSTFKFQGDKIVASNLEEAENSLISIVSKSGDYKAVLKAFQEKYQIKEKDQARDIIKQLAAGGKGGLIESGFEREGEFSFTLNEEKRAARINTMKELLTLSKGVTIATQAQTKADEAQAAELERLNQVWKEKEKLYDQSNSRYLALMGKANSMEGPTEFQGQPTTKGEKLKDAEEYRKKHVAKNRQDADEAKKAYDDYAKAILDGTAATEANTKSQKDNADVERQRKQISEQINALEQQKTKNTERLTQLQEKGAKATKEQVKAEGEAVTTGKNMNELLQEKERITARLTEKQAKLKKAQEDLAKMTKEETTASKEQSSVTEELTKKTEEYNAETEKLANMKEGRNKARGVIRNADRSISNADDAIATLKNEPLPQRKSESEMGAMKKRVAELTAEVEKETAAFNKNAQAITELNKKETQAAIEMAQSENVSIEKVKQSIELLQKKIQTEATDADTMKQRGEAINRLSERLTQMNAEVVKLSKPIADRLNTKNLGTLNETELQQSIDAAKQLLKTYKTGSDEAKQLADRIVNAEKHLKDTGIEAARAAQGIQLMQDQLSKGDALTESALKAQANYWQRLIDDPKTAADALEQYKQNLKTVGDLQADLSKKQNVEQADRLLHRGYLNLSEDELQKAITGAREYQKTLQPTEDHYKTMSRLIIEAENHLKNYGMEALRAADKQAEADALMQRQLAQGTALTESALKAQVQYWQRLADDPKTAAEAVKQYTANMEQAQALLDKSRESDIREKAGRLQNMDSYSVSEIREGIDAAKKMQDTFKLTDVEVKQLSEDIVAAETRMSKISVEAERQAQRQRESVELMESQLRNGANLTESALKAQVQYWQRLADDPKTAAEAVKQYTANMEQAQALLDKSRESDIREKAGRLQNMDNYSVSEIREGIDAAKKMQDTFKLTDVEVKQLSEDIVAAETRISKISVETERSARKEAQTISDMREQLNLGYSLTESALKAQENYWRRLADQPGQAADKVREYTANMKEAQELQKDISFARINTEGKDALDFFRGDTSNASADQIKEQADALKKYRNSLPRKDNADLLIEIDSYLAQAGKTAKEATGELMNLGEALEMAGKAGKDGFSATEDEIKKAIASIEKAIEIDRELAKQHRRAGNTQMAEYNEEEIKEYEKALNGLNLELKNVGISHERMQKILENPINADNLDELRAAIKRAKAELNSMDGALGENRKQYDEMSKSVKQAEQQLKAMEGQAKGTASAFDKAWSRLKTYVGLYVGASVAMNKLMGTIGDIHELSDRMGEVAKTTDLSADAVGRLTTNLKKIDTRTGIVQLLELSAAAGQLGLKSEEDIQGFTEAANKLMVALPEMGKEAATEMMRVAIATGEVNKIQKEMQEGTIEGSSATAVAMEKIASTIDRLRASSASAAPEITDFVKRVGAVGAQSGITIDQVAALGSTVSSLGMRIEMSATALSRMIPAIKGNAFELSKAIGVTPETIRNLFDTGRGMEVILMILQRIKDSGMDADSIENMLGMAGMRDIMKDLNQQGARAGIVFSGLSQNVDVLRQQLGIAKEAYEENIAIQKEYDRMNETTAAKWERLRNQVEEIFVGDTARRLLGDIIDGLRWIVDLLAEDNGISVALKGIIIYLALVRVRLVSIASGALTAIGGGLKNIAIMLGFIKGEMTKLQWGNIVTAAAAAVLYLVTAMKDATAAVSSVSKAIGQLEESLRKEIGTLDELFHAVSKTNVELEKSRSRLEEVKKAGGDAADAENKLKKANADHASTIREINSKYGNYLGYMLSETSSAEQLARARELINSKLRETITLKQREAALGSIEQEFGGNVNKKAASVDQTLQTLYGKDYNRAARVSVAISEAAQKYAKDSEGYQKAVKDILSGYKVQGANVKNVSGKTAKDALERYMKVFEDYRKSIEEYQTQEEIVNSRFEAQVNVTRKNSREKAVASLNAIQKDWQELVTKYQKAEGEEKEKLAAEVYKQQRNYANSLANNAEYFDNDKRKEIFNKNVKNMATYEKGLRSVAGEAIRTIDAMERAETKITNTDFTNGGESANNPWGKALGGESTDWKNMTAEQLVNRRKQMKDFVNAIQTDTDVQSVLKEDAALRKAIEKGMSADMRTVIEWYNTERLKIQDELHARYLTNTGDWMDPKKQRNAHKQFQNEVKAYLEELDAYYTERNQKIQDARNNEEITEGEAWRRTIKNETEWHNRRAELQKLYAEKGAEVTKEEQDAIFAIIAERTGDDEKFIQQMIQKTIGFAKQIEKTGEKGAAVAHKWRADLGLGWERDYLKSAQSIGKQMKFIEDTLAKERPYDGITKNLQENLDKMGVLAAQYKRINDELEAASKEKKYSDAEITAQTYKEMAFYLRQAEDAWSIDIDELLRRMAEEGMTTTAEEISKSDMLKQAVMGQLRKTFEEVQNAVKKEASQIKKDVDIIWNDDTRGPGGMSMKATFDKAIARLGMQQDSVSRANSLIGAGVASDNVAARLAMKQIEVQMRMQKAQYDMYRVQASQRITALKAEAAEHKRIAKQMKQEGNIMEAERENLAATNALRDAENVKRSLGLTLAEETKKEEEHKAELLKIQEESQNRLYQELRSWADLLASSMQGVMEASHAGDAEYYNELAKLNLTGKGGPGAGTYIIIDNEGTEDATAHYEYLNERQALERQREIENDNAVAEAWEKMWDDINQKMSDTITDQLNAMLQNQSIDANTQAVIANTKAIYASMGGEDGAKIDTSLASSIGAEAGTTPPDIERIGYEAEQQVTTTTTDEGAPSMFLDPNNVGLIWEQQAVAAEASAERQVAAIDKVNTALEDQFHKQSQGSKDAGKTMTASTQSSFAKMTAAMNMYGIAYQAMSNDNLDATQKFQMFALQAAGQTAIGMLTTNMLQTDAQSKVELPGILGKAASQLGPIAGPIAFAAMSALLGGLMGIAISKVGKAKSQISQVTGASVGAGRLSTGMLTYKEGNVNEFTDPDSLTPGRSYNVDGADGKTYRAKYTGTNPKTHITNGPEFHLVGEAGREAIIDAHTTRLMQMDDTGIWQAIQTLYNGGSLSAVRRSGARRGVPAFADGNLDEFDEMADGGGLTAGTGMSPEQMAAFQQSLDRNSAIMERLEANGIKAYFDVYGKGGLVDSYDTGKKNVTRHGERY